MSHIEILFKEYDTLRSEIIARTNALYQFIGVGIGIVLAFATFAGFDLKSAVLAIEVLGVLAIFVFRTFSDIGMCCARLREIEAKINSLAGDTLLEWESKWSSGVTGFFVRRNPNSI